MTFAHWLVVLSALVSLSGSVAYIRNTIKGQTKPNRVSWFLWALAPLIGTGAALSAHADMWATTRTFLAGFIPLMVLFVSFLNPQSYWKLSGFDYACGAFSVLALVVWGFADSPRMAVLFAATADGLAALPTIRKAWKKPETETGLTYLAGLVAVLLVLPSIPKWNIENSAFQIYLLAINAFILLAIYRKQLGSAKSFFRKPGYIFLVLLAAFFLWQGLKRPATTGNWQPELAVLSTAEFNGDLVTIKNVRNFQYNGSEKDEDIRTAYYNKTYDLKKLTKVWYITEPFSGWKAAAHTFLSFEFSNGDFLTLTIEARKVKGQEYSLFKGLLHTYPIIYIAADERDSVFVRANIRKSEVYVYPVKLSKPENGRLLLADMLNRMNDLGINPDWYNTLWANCTSSIAYHINRISPHRLGFFSWQLWLTGYADELALKSGLLDTELPLEQARQKFYISKRSQEAGYAPDYSFQIRRFPAETPAK